MSVRRRMPPGNAALASRALAMLMLLMACQVHAAVTLEITGVEDDLAENVRLTVGQPRRFTERSIERYVDGIPESAGRALSALGYYGAQIEARVSNDGEESEATRRQRKKNAQAARKQRREASQTEQRRLREQERRRRATGATAPADADSEAAGKSARRPTKGAAGETRQSAADTAELPEPDITVEVKIDPGAPVRVQNIEIAVNGPANGTGAFAGVIAKSALKRGEIFVSSDYEGTKSALQDQAQDLGYFDFEFTTTSVRVSRQNRSANIDLQADSGPRYTFGRVKLEQDIFSADFLRRWIPFEEGEPFDSEQIAELTENLQKSNYFSSVRVLPQQDRRYGTTVPIIVRLKRRPNNLVGVGIGVSTDDEGVRGKLTWNKPLVNRFGHSFDASLGVSAVRQNLSLAYRIPRKNKPLTNYFSFEYGVQNVESDPESLLSTLNFQRVRRYGNDWVESLFIRWEHETSTIAGREITTDLVLPGVSYTRARTKGRPFTRWGQSEAFTIMYGNRHLLSTIDFLKATINLKFLRSLSNRNTVILGLQYGAIETSDFSRVPASQRFFAGGDNSIRGFKFRDVGPRNANDEAIGGRYLEVASLEYQYHFLPLWAVAMFVDAGRAFSDIDEPYSAGAGIGIRWQSPVGPFKVDVAAPISGEDSGARVHLSLGPDIR